MSRAIEQAGRGHAIEARRFQATLILLRTGFGALALAQPLGLADQHAQRPRCRRHLERIVVGVHALREQDAVAGDAFPHPVARITIDPGAPMPVIAPAFVPAAAPPRVLTDAAATPPPTRIEDRADWLDMGGPF